jgi:multicomponent Na+:H+ antiporter subunit D
VLRAAGRIWLGWGTAESASPDVGTADDSGDEAEDRPDTTEPPAADGVGAADDWGTEGGAPHDGATDGDTTDGQGSAPDDAPDGQERSRQPGRVPLTMLLPPLALLAIGLGLGLVPGLEAQAAAAAAAFSDRAVYAAQVLGTHGSTTPASGPVVAAASHAVSVGGLLTDLGQVAVALGVAAIALDRRAVRLRRALAAGTGWLRRLHSGLVGDQVTWLVAGLALLAALGGVALR